MITLNVLRCLSPRIDYFAVSSGWTLQILNKNYQAEEPKSTYRPGQANTLVVVFLIFHHFWNDHSRPSDTHAPPRTMMDESCRSWGEFDGVLGIVPFIPSLYHFGWCTSLKRWNFNIHWKCGTWWKTGNLNKIEQSCHWCFVCEIWADQQGQDLHGPSEVGHVDDFGVPRTKEEPSDWRTGDRLNSNTAPM